MASDFCENCGRDLGLCDWDGEDNLCDHCKAEEDSWSWMEATESAARQLAEKHGWIFERAGGGVNTRSRYYELTREGLDGEGNDDVQTIRVRISDHATAYCSEDVSLSKDGSGDDHTLAVLERVLQGKFAADSGY